MVCGAFLCPDLPISTAVQMQGNACFNTIYCMAIARNFSTGCLERIPESRLVSALDMDCEILPIMLGLLLCRLCLLFLEPAQGIQFAFAVPDVEIVVRILFG